MTANRPDLNDEQFERLLSHTGQQLSIPPMRDGVKMALERIRSEQTLLRKPNPNNHLALSNPSTGPDADHSSAAFLANGEPERSRWREIGLLAGGIAAAAAVTLVLVLVFGEFGSSGDSGDLVPAAAPFVEPVAFSDPALAASILMERNDTDGGSFLLPVDPSTGELLQGYVPIPGFIWWGTISADRSTLATIESHDRICEPISGGTACRPTADVLHIVDVPGWSARSVDLPGGSWVSRTSLSQDGQRIAVTITFRGAIGEPAPTRILMIDTTTLQTLAEREIDFRPSLVEFALEDTALVVYGQRLGENPGVDEPDSPQMLVLNAETLEPNIEHTFIDLLSGYWCVSGCSGVIQDWEMVEWSPGITITLDGSAMIVVYPEADLLTQIDLSTGELHDLELELDTAWYDSLTDLFVSDVSAKGAADGVWRELAWSPDGNRLYVLTHYVEGRENSANEDGLLQVIDPVTGRILAERVTESAWNITVAPESGELLVEMNGRSALTTIVDGESLQPVIELEGYDIAVSSTLDGQPLLMAEIDGEDGTMMAVLDAQTYEISHIWTTDAGQCYLTGSVPSCEVD